MSAYEESLKSAKLRPHRERLERIATAVLPALIRTRTDTTAQELSADALDYARALVAAIDGDTP